MDGSSGGDEAGCDDEPGSAATHASDPETRDRFRCGGCVFGADAVVRTEVRAAVTWAVLRMAAAASVGSIDTALLAPHQPQTPPPPPTLMLIQVAQAAGASRWRRFGRKRR